MLENTGLAGNCKLAGCRQARIYIASTVKSARVISTGGTEMIDKSNAYSWQP